MSKKLLSGPYLVWMVGFTIIPLALILYYGLTDRTGAFTLENVLAIATAEHAKALWLSLGLSLASTLLCLLLAYPLAMILRGRGAGAGGFIVFIFILPMWMNFLLRTLAWQTLLEKGGVMWRSWKRWEKKMRLFSAFPPMRLLSLKTTADIIPWIYSTTIRM